MAPKSKSGFQRRKRKHERKEVEELFAIGAEQSSVGVEEDIDLDSIAKGIRPGPPQDSGDTEPGPPQDAGDTDTQPLDRGTVGASPDTGSEGSVRGPAVSLQQGPKVILKKRAEAKRPRLEKEERPKGYVLE